MTTAYRSVACVLVSLALGTTVLAGCQNPNTANTTEVTPIGGGTETVATGQSIYESNCASCHGVTGSGSSSMVLESQVAFDNPEWHKRYTDEQIIGSIKNGKGMMPAFGSSISDADLKTLVEYMRSLAKAKS